MIDIIWKKIAFRITFRALSLNEAKFLNFSTSIYLDKFEATGL